MEKRGLSLSGEARVILFENFAPRSHQLYVTTKKNNSGIEAIVFISRKKD